MLSTAKIDEIASQAAVRHLKREAVEKVSSRATTDSEGQDAVRIVITLKPDVARGLDGDAVLDTLVEINSKLSEAGEERTSIVEYAETGEAIEADDGDAQS